MKCKIEKDKALRNMVSNIVFGIMWLLYFGITAGFLFAGYYGFIETEMEELIVFSFVAGALLVLSAFLLALGYENYTDLLKRIKENVKG